MWEYISIFASPWTMLMKELFCLLLFIKKISPLRVQDVSTWTAVLPFHLDDLMFVTDICVPFADGGVDDDDDIENDDDDDNDDGDDNDINCMK